MSRNYDVPNFEERFVKLFDDGQIDLHCDESVALLKEARDGLTYNINTIPAGKMLRVIVGDNEEYGNDYLDCGDVGFFTWKTNQDIEDILFFCYNEESKEWCYLGYDDLKECRFELIVDETVEIEC